MQRQNRPFLQSKMRGGPEPQDDKTQPVTRGSVHATRHQARAGEEAAKIIAIVERDLRTPMSTWTGGMCFLARIIRPHKGGDLNQRGCGI